LDGPAVSVERTGWGLTALAGRLAALAGRRPAAAGRLATLAGRRPAAAGKRGAGADMSLTD